MEEHKKKENDSKKLYFEKMTPVKCDKMQYYEEALDYAFSQDDVLNIAITGLNI